MSVRLDQIAAVRLVTQDPERLQRFYAEALGALVEPPLPIPPDEAAFVGAGKRRPLRLGAQRLELDCFAEPGAPYPPDVAADDPRFQHIAVVVADIGAVHARAMACGAGSISSTGPVRLPASSGGATAVKLRDPDGHPFELIALAPGPWDGIAPNTCGVRGVDHSAITVADVDASRRFYAEYGLTHRGGTLNHGPEQAALDGLSAPTVEVAPLFPAVDTPHLELLGYRDVRPAVRAPCGDRDVAATALVWIDPSALAPSWLRDPDGHRHVVIAP
jgi:catechol 2,3-dioxygenase-like lactoylglutathione lyase family enzyme